MCTLHFGVDHRVPYPSTLRRMVVWDYWHHIDYHRKLANGERVLEHTEVVEDGGWCIGRTGLTREQWLATYTRWCAEDFLGRVGATPGIWVVIVWRTPKDAKRTLLCSIEMPWRVPPSDNDVGNGLSARVDGQGAGAVRSSRGRRVRR